MPSNKYTKKLSKYSDCDKIKKAAGEKIAGYEDLLNREIPGCPTYVKGIFKKVQKGIDKAKKRVEKEQKRYKTLYAEDTTRMNTMIEKSKASCEKVMKRYTGAWERLLTKKAAKYTGLDSCGTPEGTCS